MVRERFSSGTVWEPIVGYSRALRAGSTIHVSGTTATDDRGALIGKGDPTLQTRRALHNIENALQQLGASLEDVVRTRIYVRDINHWEAIGRVHGEFFHSILPATSMVEVNRLIDPEMLVEIEAVAILHGESGE